MSNAKKFGMSVALVLATILGAFVFAVSRGYLDSGLFEVQQTDWSPSGKVAMLAKRSDHQAMRSDEYFVLIADHIFSASEVRDAFYRNREVFNASSTCLSIRWSDPHNLTVSCHDGSLDADHINFQRPNAGDIKVTYINIPGIRRGVK